MRPVSIFLVVFICYIVLWWFFFKEEPAIVDPTSEPTVQTQQVSDPVVPVAELRPQQEEGAMGLIVPPEALKVEDTQEPAVEQHLSVDTTELLDWLLQFRKITSFIEALQEEGEAYILMLEQHNIPSVQQRYDELARDKGKLIFPTDDVKDAIENLHSLLSEIVAQLSDPPTVNELNAVIGDVKSLPKTVNAVYKIVHSSEE